MKYKLSELVTPQNYERMYLQDEINRAPSYYKDMKGKYPDAILLYRAGDFYETYCEDAATCAEILGITLTLRREPSYRMAGFPKYALDVYLPKLVRAGHRIAICERD